MNSAWASGASGDVELEKHMLAAFREAFELWAEKQRAYSSNNIAQAGEHGVLLRANDKVQRLRTLLTTGGEFTATKACESLRDSWLDLINYAAMGLLLRDGHWPLPTREELSNEPATCRHCGKEIG